MEGNKKISLDCPCTYPDCLRHGSREACKEYHHSLGRETATAYEKWENRDDGPKPGRDGRLD